jgi:methyltransferase (TIGR00027 family)
MRKNQISLTAAGIALMRAIESEKPARERICYDPYARRFIPGWMYHIFGFFIKAGYTEIRGPGVQGFLVARERYIDDTLQGFLENDLQQLVILGAGYDSRAYRFDVAGKVKTFEVDHPATQADKQAKVRAVFGILPEHVTYVPIDFNTQSLEERLFDSRYDPTLKTFFIWQGVSMYLTAEAVDATLRFVTEHAGHGSAIVFDYIYREALDGIRKQNEVGNMRRYRFITGEGLTFGIPIGTIYSFLELRGFHQVKNVDADDLKAAYFTGGNTSRAIVGGYGVAIGMI